MFSPTNAIIHRFFSTMQGFYFAVKSQRLLLITVSAASASSFKIDTNGML
jgi:hypothetical protein